jgi:hypothetical protein
MALTVALFAQHNELLTTSTLNVHWQSHYERWAIPADYRHHHHKYHTQTFSIFPTNRPSAARQLTNAERDYACKF